MSRMATTTKGWGLYPRIGQWMCCIILALWLHSCGTGRNAVSRGKAEKQTVQTHQSTNRQPAGNTVPSPVPTKAKAVVDEGYSWLGTKYKYGGSTKAGTDCSGMIVEIFLKTLNVKLPRTSWEQQAYCIPVNIELLQPGDLIFFAPNNRNQVSHVGLYIGNDNMIHASPTQGVTITNIFDNYFRRHFHSAGRVAALVNETPTNSSTTPQQKPTKVISIQLDDLENVLNQKTDSIFSSFND